ncbi:MAG: MurR/RpiR family transcriptional regulator [Erythrobacter sp.]|jgi:DNA-binding MurR/RpiR family transcriptional regulator|nr:MurR/RpiR family transcriptional regulator [Erythrobacter sp.]
MVNESESAKNVVHPGLAEFSRKMELLARSGAPSLRALAAWLADHPEEIAFHSVRGLAKAAGTDPNTVMRTTKAAGFSGFAEARKIVQLALKQENHGYVARADALRQTGSGRLLEAMAQAAQSNTRQVFSPALTATIEEIVPHLLSARQVHCIGVRMAYALAHYFTYRGGIAHAHVRPAPALPGLLLDSLIESGPDDVVIAISFAHYSTEVIRAAGVARERGARVLALTDRRDSPLAEGAWRVLLAPVEGPNVMYSIVGAMTIIEALLELMAAGDTASTARIEAFERGLLGMGAYMDWHGGSSVG